MDNGKKKLEMLGGKFTGLGHAEEHSRNSLYFQTLSEFHLNVLSFQDIPKRSSSSIEEQGNAGINIVKSNNDYQASAMNAGLPLVFHGNTTFVLTNNIEDRNSLSVANKLHVDEVSKFDCKPGKISLKLGKLNQVSVEGLNIIPGKICYTHIECKYEAKSRQDRLCDMDASSISEVQVKEVQTFEEQTNKNDCSLGMDALTELPMDFEECQMITAATSGGQGHKISSIHEMQFTEVHKREEQTNDNDSLFDMDALSDFSFDFDESQMIAAASSSRHEHKVHINNDTKKNNDDYHTLPKNVKSICLPLGPAENCCSALIVSEDCPNMDSSKILVNNEMHVNEVHKYKQQTNANNSLLDVDSLSELPMDIEESQMIAAATSGDQQYNAQMKDDKDKSNDDNHTFPKNARNILSLGSDEKVQVKGVYKSEKQTSENDSLFGANAVSEFPVDFHESQIISVATSLKQDDIVQEDKNDKTVINNNHCFARNTCLSSHPDGNADTVLETNVDCPNIDSNDDKKNHVTDQNYKNLIGDHSFEKDFGLNLPREYEDPACTDCNRLLDNKMGNGDGKLNDYPIDFNEPELNVGATSSSQRKKLQTESQSAKIDNNNSSVAKNVCLPLPARGNVESVSKNTVDCPIKDLNDFSLLDIIVGKYKENTNKQDEIWDMDNLSELPVNYWSQEIELINVDDGNNIKDDQDATNNENERKCEVAAPQNHARKPWSTSCEVVNPTLAERNDKGNQERLVSNVQVRKRRTAAPFAGFTTASEKKVVISDRSMQRARKILNEVNKGFNIVDAPVNEGCVLALDARPANHQFVSCQVSESFPVEKVFNTANLSVSSAGLSGSGASTKLLNSKQIVPNAGQQLIIGGKDYDKSVTMSANVFSPVLKKKLNIEDVEQYDVIAEVSIKNANGILCDIPENNLSQKTERLLNHKEHEEYCNNRKIKKFEGFSTALGNVIKISEKSLKKAQMIIKEVNNETKQCRSIITSRQENIPEHTELLKRKPVAFTTASGKDVAVSKASIQEAKYLMDENVDCLKKRKVEDHSLGFTTPSIKNMVVSKAPSKDPLQEAKGLGDNDNFNSPKIRKLLKERRLGFTTASGKNETVSETSIKIAKSLFCDKENVDSVNDVPVNFTTPSENKAPISAPFTKKAKGVLFDEGIADRSLKRRSLSVIPKFAFSTASEKEIPVSEASLTVGRKLLNDIENGSHCLRRNTANRIDGSPEVKSTTNGNVGYTNSTGKCVENKIFVSEKSLKKARRIVNDVSTDTSNEIHHKMKQPVVPRSNIPKFDAANKMSTETSCCDRKSYVKPVLAIQKDTQNHTVQDETSSTPKQKVEDDDNIGSRLSRKRLSSENGKIIFSTSYHV